MALGPYEAGLTPEEREQQDTGAAAGPPLINSQFTRQGMRMRMAMKNPLLALALGGALGPKLASFNDELTKIVSK